MWKIHQFLSNITKDTHKKIGSFFLPPWGRKKEPLFFYEKNLFNTQCNFTKFNTFIVNEYYHRCYLFTLISTGYCTKKYDVGYFAINHGVMKLMITG